MTLETFYFVAQIVAAFAVVASLVFVGLQVRENTKEQALRRAIERNATYTQSQTYLIENKDIREVWVKGAYGLSPLNEEERVAYGAYMTQWLASMMDVLAQRNAGQMPDDDWERMPFTARPVTVRKGAFEWWQRVRHTFKSDVQEFFDYLFEEGQRPAHPPVDEDNSVESQNE